VLEVTTWKINGSADSTTSEAQMLYNTINLAVDYEP
jgi:hypothetical protein